MRRRLDTSKWIGCVVINLNMQNRGPPKPSWFGKVNGPKARKGNGPKAGKVATEMNQRIYDLEDKINGVEGKVDEIKINLYALQGKIDSMESKIDMILELLQEGKDG